MAIVVAVRQNVKLGCLTACHGSWPGGSLARPSLSYGAFSAVIFYCTRFCFLTAWCFQSGIWIVICFLSTLKIEAITVSESLVHIYQYTRCYIPEDRNLSVVFSESGYAYNYHGQKELKVTCVGKVTTYSVQSLWLGTYNIIILSRETLWEMK